MKQLVKEQLPVLLAGTGIAVGTPLLVIGVVLPGAQLLMIAALAVLVPSMIFGMR
jgi:hypothetical protein